MKKEKQGVKGIIWRLIKVFYFFLLLYGIWVVAEQYVKFEPYPIEYYSYEVVCYNGESFDPTSKPIETEPLSGFFGPLIFDETQIKAECEYGNAWLVGSARAGSLSKNFTLETQKHENMIGTKKKQILVTIQSAAVLFGILEVLRRAFLYIVFGKSPLPFRKRKKKSLERKKN